MTASEYQDILSKRLGIRITQKEFNHIFDLYKKATGSTESIYPQLSRIGIDLANQNHFEYRAGSKWSGHSKFVIDGHNIIFSPNCASRNKKEQRQIEKASQQFEKRVKEYLNQLKE